MRTFYPCVHSRDFYRISSADVASRGDRGNSYYRSGVHDDMVVIGGLLMKVVVMKLPKFLRGITKAIFKIK